MPEAVIVATARSPIGRAGKSLASMRPDDLASAVVTALFDKVPKLPPTDVEDLVLGSAQVGEFGWNVARWTAILAGADNAAGLVVNRGCASSLQAISIAANSIKAGEGTCFVAGGVEVVSRYDTGYLEVEPNPLFDEAQQRSAKRSEGDQGPWTPSGGLPDAYIAMGQTAENVAEIDDVSREDMDRFAQRSQERVQEAIASGFYAEEITPIKVADGTVVSADESPRPGTTLEGLSALQPVFRPDGRVTAGNACPLNDGAAAVVVMSDELAKARGITPIARVVSTGVSALDPEIMGLGPVGASEAALRQAGLTIDDIDLVEINEAFAAQVLASARRLGIPLDKLNVHGGSIALGHPFGMTGARIMTTLLHGMQVTDACYGLETMCVGGGMGLATIVERLS